MIDIKTTCTMTVKGGVTPGMLETAQAVYVKTWGNPEWITANIDRIRELGGIKR